LSGFPREITDARVSCPAALSSIRLMSDYSDYSLSRSVSCAAIHSRGENVILELIRIVNVC